MRFDTLTREPARASEEPNQRVEGIKSSTLGTKLELTPMATQPGDIIVVTPSSSETVSPLGAADGVTTQGIGPGWARACLNAAAVEMNAKLAKASVRRGRSIVRSTKPCEPQTSSA